MSLFASPNCKIILDMDDERTLEESVAPIDSVEYSRTTESDEEGSDSSSVTNASLLTAPKLDFDEHSTIATLLSTKLLQKDEKTVADALNQIADLCFHGSEHAHENTKAIYQHGTLLLIHVMKQFYGSPKIQLAGLRALQNASSGHDRGLDRDFCRSVVSVGALQVVLLAMRNHERDALIQTDGCATLYNLMVGSKKRVSKFVMEMNGLETVVKALKGFPVSGILQEQGIRLLDVACRWSEFRPFVHESGGLIALAKAMAEHPELEQLQVMARRTMSTLCKPSKRMQLPKLSLKLKNKKDTFEI